MLPTLQSDWNKYVRENIAGAKSPGSKQIYVCVWIKSPLPRQSSFDKEYKKWTTVLIDISYRHVWFLITNDMNSYKLTTVVRAKESMN